MKKDFKEIETKLNQYGIDSSLNDLFKNEAYLIKNEAYLIKNEAYLR